jgi:DNA-binding transcriptional regulator YdaS (Cro superfamily)
MRKNKVLLKIVKKVGSVSEVARAIGVSRQSVSMWLHCKRTVSATAVKKLVEISEGEVTEEELRPDVFGK